MDCAEDFQCEGCDNSSCNGNLACIGNVCTKKKTMWGECSRDTECKGGQDGEAGKCGISKWKDGKLDKAEASHICCKFKDGLMCAQLPRGKDCADNEQCASGQCVGNVCA